MLRKCVMYHFAFYDSCRRTHIYMQSKCFVIYYDKSPPPKCGQLLG